MKALSILVLATFCLRDAECPAASPVIISEFMASNARTLADEEGSFEDWIEVLNVGTNAVNLLDWSLTDNAGNLTKWRFPATNLPPGAFLIVFASNKDRRVAGARLHTNFRLTTDGEYLALVAPDGSLASEFSPAFAPQVQDVSYGFGLEIASTQLMTTGAVARVLVPTSDTLGLTWTGTGFDDSSWLEATNGLGFDAGVPDSAEDSYTQAIAVGAPLGWWRFSEMSGNTLTNSGSLGSAITGTNLNLSLNQAGPRPTAFGGFETNNRAARFNGSSARLRIPDHPAFDFGTGPFSIELWFNPANAGTRGDLFTYKGTGQDFGIHVASQGANTLSVFHNTFIGTGGGISNNVWHHVVVAREPGGQLTVYLNGAALFSGTDTASMDIANDLLLGSNHAGSPANGTLFFNGLIDEVAIYSRALTVSEAQRHYQRGLSGGVSYADQFLTDLRPAMHGVNSTAFVRLPFTVTNLAALDRLVLRLKYDDGFSAWINGQEIAARHVPVSLGWNSTATDRHDDAAAVVFEEFEVSDFHDFVHDGTNVLAIQGLNIEAGNADFLIVAELLGLDLGEVSIQPRYFLLPTPGSANGVGSADLGPIIAEVTSTPALPTRPTDSDNITVVARVSPAFAPLASVTLKYRVMFGATNSVPMSDDGLHGDGAAGDGVFGTIIPASASTPGQMVRWFITSADTSARVSRWPLFEDALGSPEYLGTVIANPAVTSALPTWEWFAQDVTAARGNGTRGAVLFLGRFYDNVRIRRRGAATTNGQKFDFNRGFRCFVSVELDELDEVNLNNEASDPSFIRPPLAYESFRVAGNAACQSFNMLLRVNSGTDRVGVYVEQVDERFLERNGLSPDGALYKFVQRGALTPIFTDPSDGVEKKTRLTEDRSDLQAICTALQLTNNAAQLAQRATFVFDHFNVPALINHVACRALTMDSDDVRKNIYLHRDTLGTRQWTIFPWDKDWTFGILGDGGPFLRHPFFGDRVHRKDNALQWSLLYEAVFTEPKLAEMYLRRLRTVMDQQLQPPGTPASSGYFESRADFYLARAFPHLGAGPSNEVRNIIKNNFLTSRRADLYVTYALTNTGAPAANRLVPTAQPNNAIVTLGAIDYNPGTSNQAQEYICLTNGNPFALDISGWRLDGAVQYTFKPGTVLRAHDVLYVSPDVVAFRARPLSPRGGEGLFVQGNYQGQLSARGETVRVLDSFGRPVHSIAYLGTPSLAQQFLRITELMYHPAPFVVPALAGHAGPAEAGTTNNPEDFEFIELKNVSTNVTLDLRGVRFTNGLEFDFAVSSVPSLAPGATVLVVKNLAAFSARHPDVSPAHIAGSYAGNLENQGERIQLVDATGEEILDFSYDNQWYKITDGLGFSLVVVDEKAAPETWGNKAQWRPSGQGDGSPAASDPAPPLIPSLLITEVLSRTDLAPPTDTIELHNPTGAIADLGGWFLSDDFNTPKKFRIPETTRLGPGGYIVFDESQFNPGGNGFALGSDGEEVWLFSADTNGNLTGYVQGFEFGAANDSVSFGRYVTSVGAEHFVAQSMRTLGTNNARPSVGPLVISEIMYRPPDAGTNDNSIDEFIELENIGAGLGLHDPLRPTNTWKITGGVEFEFPPSTELVTSEILLLVNFDPATNGPALAAFRTKYGVPATVRILGPYRGKLDNSSDTIELGMPTTPFSGQVPYVVVEKVRYQDSAPWPAGADGFGYSLQRQGDYGNDPTNWVAASPTAGRPTALMGPAPVITVQPMSQTVLAYGTVTLGVMETSVTPPRYQWRFNGLNLPGATNATLQINNVQPRDFGDYQVLVSNQGGSVLSSNATLNVIFGAVIFQQPQDQTVFPQNSVTFAVSASSSTSIRYQWRFNGGSIPNATNAAYTINSVLPAQEGDYAVLVTDDIGTIPSQAARLTVLTHPLFTLQPTNRTVILGSAPTNVTFTAQATSSTPITYQWQFNGMALSATNTSLTLSNVEVADSGTYRLVATDSYGSWSSAPAMLLVLVKPTITLQPISQTLVSNATATFTIAASGTPPISFRWRKNNLTFNGGIIVTTPLTSTLILTNVKSSDAATFNVAVTNLAGQASGLSSNAVLTVLADSDGDGLPDSLEPLDGAADSDGDGMSNAAEYFAGTDWLDSQSYLKVEIALTGGAVISFNAVSDRTYTVQYSDGLHPVLWKKLADVPARSTTRREGVTDPAAAEDRYYRLVTPIQP